MPPAERGWASTRLPRVPQPPWRRRQRHDVRIADTGPTSRGLSRLRLYRLGLRPRGAGRIDIKRWPPEPPSTTMTVEQLQRGLLALCGPTLASLPMADRYARLIVESAKRHGIDPLLLAALVYHQSGCRAQAKSSWGVGLTAINPRMYRFQRGRLRYGVLLGGAWHRRYLLARPYRFRVSSLLEPAANLHFAAGLLAMYRKQCPPLDGPFRSVPHRHFVSHFIWGDRVPSTTAEDQILRVRRRLIGYLDDHAPRANARYAGIAIYPPLDGPPLRVIGVMYDDRDGGRRRHLGIDLASFRGEPVRAIAAGTVVFAGVERKSGGFVDLAPQHTRFYPRRRMGPRGLFVIVRHANQLDSIYVHNESNAVRRGQIVRGGQLLGHVGRSGMRVSAAHLHLGIRHRGRLIDPLRVVGSYTYHPRETYLGQRQARQRRRRWPQSRQPGALAPARRRER